MTFQWLKKKVILRVILFSNMERYHSFLEWIEKEECHINLTGVDIIHVHPD